MEDPDKFMVRGQDGDAINLAAGEPYFLHKHLSWLVGGMRELREIFPPYPNYAGQPELLKELRLRHPGNEIVVCNGAKQALLAAIYALKERAQHGIHKMYHRAPHWPTFPTLAKLSSLSFSNDSADCTCGAPQISIMTSPNNPDSWTTPALSHSSILDCVYAHPVYGHEGPLSDHQISVWSGAKLFGVSGLRVGWLATENKELAKYAADYVEKTTSGVCSEAQGRVADILYLSRQESQLVSESYAKARVDLLENGRLFTKYIGPHCRHVQGLPATDKGMFSYFNVLEPRVFDAACKETKVLLVPGSACGATEDGWYRMSLGMEPKVLDGHLKKLAGALHG